MLNEEHYRYLYGKLNVNKIPKNISSKLDSGKEFTKEEEEIIKEIIEKDIEQNKNKEYRFVDKKVETFKKIALDTK